MTTHESKVHHIGISR